jgi:predicted acetyltransferase
MGEGERQVTVTPAAPADRTLIEGLFQFYVYDFSEMDPPGPGGITFNASGAYELYPPLASYFEEAGRHALVIRVDGEVAGFALLNGVSHRGGTVERNMGEFFVARKYRGGGVAAAAFHQVLALYPGRWEVAVVHRNARALTFWPRAIAAAANIIDLTCVEGDGTHWTGPIWCFVALPD